jgi:hypothetical protein
VLELLLARMETMQVMADAVWKETSAETRMQQGHKEPRCRRAATPEDREETREQYGRMKRKTAATTRKERI